MRESKKEFSICIRQLPFSLYYFSKKYNFDSMNLLLFFTLNGRFISQLTNFFSPRSLEKIHFIFIVQQFTVCFLCCVMDLCFHSIPLLECLLNVYGNNFVVRQVSVVFFLKSSHVMMIKMK